MFWKPLVQIIGKRLRSYRIAGDRQCQSRQRLHVCAVRKVESLSGSFTGFGCISEQSFPEGGGGFVSRCQLWLFGPLDRNDGLTGKFPGSPQPSRIGGGFSLQAEQRIFR